MDGREARTWHRARGRTPREGKTDGEGLVHDACQQQGGLLQTKRRHLPLELAQLRPKSRLPPIRGPQPQLVIAAGQIKLGEEPRPPRAVEQRVDVRERLDRRPRDGAEAPVVVADRHDPSGLRANTTDAAWPPSSAGSSRDLAVRGAARTDPRARRQTVASSAAIAASECRPSRAQAPCRGPAACRTGPAQHVSALGLKRRERRVVGAREAQFRVGQANGRLVEPRAVLEHLHTIDEADGTVGLRREA